MALMRRADTVFALDSFEEPDSSSSEEPDPKATGDPLIQNRTIQRGILKTKLEPELWTKRFAFRLYLMVISLVNVQIMALRADFGCHTFHCPDASVHTWEVLENIVTVFFVVDMAVRMIEAKPKRFFKGDESKDEYRIDVMNVFDFALDCHIVAAGNSAHTLLGGLPDCWHHVGLLGVNHHLNLDRSLAGAGLEPRSMDGQRLLGFCRTHSDHHVPSPLARPMG